MVRVASFAAFFSVVLGAVAALADVPARSAMVLARAVEARAAASSFQDLERFGAEAQERHDREGLNRLYHVAWIFLNQGDFDRARQWNARLAEAARRQDDARYIAIAHLNDLTIRYDEGETATSDEMGRIADTAEDWFVRAHAVRIHALALMDEDRIGEGLERLAEMDSRLPDDAPYARTAHAGLWEMTGIGLMKLNDVAGATAAFGRFEIDYNDPAYPRPDFDSLYNLSRLSIQIGEVAVADALYQAHHRLAARTGLESLIVYDANLCAMTAEARGAPRDVLACLEPYGFDLEPAAFLAPQMLPRRAIANAQVGNVQAAARDLAFIRRLQAQDALREEGVSRVPLAEAELLFAQGRLADAYALLRRHFHDNEVATAQRFSAGIGQVTGDMQAQLAERRHQLETAQANTRLQQIVIRSQGWIVAIAVVFLLSAIAAAAWQWRQTGHLRMARRRAEAANQAKSQFLANMSHEIRTPLNGVIAMADTLTRAELKPPEREMAEIIRSSGATLERLLSDILDSAKIESGELTLEAAPFRVGDPVRDVALLWRLRAEDKKVALSVDMDPAVDRMAFGDVTRLRQVLTNLVSNALKFTDHGLVTLGVEALPSRAAGGETLGDHWVRFTISDTGVGFGPEQKARIFTRFQQADGSITRRFGGTGLGLAISRDLVGLMGGILDGDSTPGHGSRFWFDIPLPRLEGEGAVTSITAPSAAPAAVLAAPDTDVIRVLLADDHPANRKVVEVMLSGSPVELVAVHDGAQALEAFRADPFDIVLMDMQMPVMDGLSATRAIRTHEAQHGLARTPILMLTANAMPEHVHAGREAGADGHLSKPITLAALLDGIAGALERRRVEKVAGA